MSGASPSRSSASARVDRRREPRLTGRSPPRHAAPRRRRGARRGRLRTVRRLPRRRRARRAARARDERRGDPALGRRAAARRRALRSRPSRGRAPGRRPLRRADDRRHGRARGARGRGRRRRGRGDRAAVLHARRAAQLEHFAAAARACAPLPFYVYEFARTSGYAFDPASSRACASEADNLAGLKVSDRPWEAFERYLIEGLDVFVGPEALIAPRPEAGRGRRGLGARLGVPRDRRAPRSAARTSSPARCAPRSSRSRATRRSSTCSSGAASRSARTCARRCADLDADERALESWLDAEVGAPRRDRRRPANAVLRAADPRGRRQPARPAASSRSYGMRLGAARFVAGETLDQASSSLRAPERAGAAHEHDAPRRARPRPRPRPRPSPRPTRRCSRGSTRSSSRRTSRSS